jgi:hypothetical protein
MTMLTPFHPIVASATSILALCGTVYVGRICLSRFFGRDIFVLSLSLGMVLISQTIYILSLNQDSFLLIYPVAWLLFVCGFVYLFQFRRRILYLLPRSEPNHIFVILLSLSFLLASLGPPTMADALDYHLGIPVYLLSHLEWPLTSMWLHGSLGGIGEIFNTLGLVLYADNLGAILQAMGLIGFTHYLSQNYEFKKRTFLNLFILSSPIIIFLVTGPKPQLFPQIIMAIAFHITVSNKKIDPKIFLLICILVMGAAQQKLSFLITGSVIGFWALWKSRSHAKLVIYFSLLTFIYFFVPKGIWNLRQLSEFSLIGFFTPLPLEFLESLRSYRGGSNLFFPLNIFLPTSIGNVQGILGFQVFLILLVKKTNSKFREAIFLITLGTILIYLFGQSVARSYYEIILWIAVAFSFLNGKEFRFNVGNRFLVAQSLYVLTIAIFAVYSLTPGSLSHKWRDEIMHRSANDYSSSVWLNSVLPKNAVVLSFLRSVSLLERDFISRDWLFKDNLDRKDYYKMIKHKKVNFIVIKGPLTNEVPLFGCVGKEFAGPKSFKSANRNPFNNGEEYSVTIYRFNSSLLPSCKL